ncbi:recombinase-like helix-turn-helix domain-containing protein [Leekyejoonella antrihumi]|uniref:Recombinase-like domain-containing protein n=1 Tax=Leekyejoonella antrihumi TaxID=1660198 RepID=A0A563DWT5_9MICO|nr:recombinase-like helix-turn-helix domain-containing protein [Leekyejoonella antrihumi]TWP34687.1 hypothetical protein FGL98_16365 [Leekyejoonella antrihumi]
MQAPLYLEPNQTREGPLTPYEAKLSGLIQRVFAEGHYGLQELVQGLNDHGSTAPDGAPWTEESFRAEMSRLGA